MGKARTSYHLDEQTRWGIISFKQHGLSDGDVALQLGVDRKTVMLWWNRFKKEGNVGHAVRRMSTRKMTDADKTLVHQTMLGGIKASTRKMARGLRQATGTKVSRETIRRYLQSLGWYPHHRFPVVRLTEKQRKERIKWCKLFKDKKKDFWRHVLYTDEKNFASTWPGNRKNDISWARREWRFQADLSTDIKQAARWDS